MGNHWRKGEWCEMKTLILLFCLLIFFSGCLEDYTWDTRIVDQYLTTVKYDKPSSDRDSTNKKSNILSDYTTSTRFSSTTLYKTTSLTSTTSTTTIYICPERALTPCSNNTGNSNAWRMYPRAS